MVFENSNWWVPVDYEDWGMSCPKIYFDYGVSIHQTFRIFGSAIGKS